MLTTTCVDRSPSSMFRVGGRVTFVFVLACILACGCAAVAQEAKSGDAGSNSAQDKQSDPLKRPLTEKQKKENAKSLRHELGKTYKKWLDEDVAYIISDEEKSAFKQLSNDEERDQFIEAFWQRR